MTDPDTDSDSEEDESEYNDILKDWQQVFSKSGMVRSSSESPYLNETDINDILSGQRDQDQLNQDDIEEALAGIAKRMRRLMLDIAILSYSGHIDDIDKNWNFLAKIDKIEEELEGSTEYMNIALRNSTERDVDTSNDPYSFDLGFNTGIVLSELTGTAREDDRGLRFLHGIIEGYTTENFESTPQTVPYETNGPRLDPLHPEPLPSQDKVFTRNNIAPTDYMRGLCVEHKILSEKMEHLPEMSLVEATEHYVEEKIGEWFQKCSQLRQHLDEEWTTIDDASVPGPDIYKILKSLWKLSYDRENSNIGSDDIRKVYYDRKSTYNKSVTQILNRLAENGKNKSKEAQTEFEHNVVVSYNNRWELTDYGRLLFYHVFEKDQDPEWIQIAAIQRPIFNSGYIKVTDQEIQILEKAVENYFDD